MQKSLKIRIDIADIGIDIADIDITISVILPILILQYQ
jgi:hypothetical protein